MTLKKRNVISFLIIICLFVCIFFPADKYNLKIITLFCMGIVGYGILINKIEKKKYLFISLFGLVYPIFTIVHSIVLTQNIVNPIKRGYVPLLLIIVIFCLEYKVDYKKWMIRFLKAEAFIIVAIVVFDIIGIIDVNNGPIRAFVYTYDIAFMGKSPEYTSYYKIFFKTSPLILFLIDYAWQKREK